MVTECNILLLMDKMEFKISVHFNYDFNLENVHKWKWKYELSILSK